MSEAIMTTAVSETDLGRKPGSPPLPDPRQGKFGLSCALVTPFRSDGSCDTDRLVRHALSRLSAGCSSVTAFGTTGEGASLGNTIRKTVLAELVRSGISPRDQLVVGIATANIEESAQQIREALDSECKAVLLAPPYYFKNVSDDGLFSWFSACFERVGSDVRDVILYHIPSVTAAPLSLPLIGRLKETFPSVIRGVKDSGGDWTYSSALLETHKDIEILIGDERYLAKAVGLGAKGSIAGTANFISELLAPMIWEARDDGRVAQIVSEILKFPVTPAVKAIVAHLAKDDKWLAVAPPLMPITSRDRESLVLSYDRIMMGAS